MADTDTVLTHPATTLVYTTVELDLRIEYPGGTPGGPPVFEVEYHPRKKIHVIRVVFQDKAVYARTSFRGAKTCKIGKKGVFLAI